MRARIMLAGFIVISCANPAYAQSGASDKYAYCSNYAAQQSGWNGSSQNPNSKAVARGGAVGAGAGALIGGMGGGDSGRGAAIGAAFGLIAGESRRQKGAQQAQNQENAYYSILNSCMQQ
jgi:hypothetical protein